MAVLVLGMSQAVWGKRVPESERDVRKADYVYLEALHLKGDGKNDAYYSLVEYASDLNPADNFLNKERGLKMILESNGDSSMVAGGMERVRNYVNKTPDDFYAGVMYASLASQMGDNAEAVATLGNLYRHFPDRTDVGGSYADRLAASGRADDIRRALAIYDSIEMREGDDVNIFSRKIQLYNMMGDTAAVLREAHRMLDSSPQSVPYNIIMGSIFTSYENNDSALAYFDRALEIDPTSGLAYYHKAGYYKNIGDSVGYDREVFNALRQPDLDMEPKLGILREYVADLYTDSTQHQRITSLFHTLIDQYPHEVDVRNLYGDYLMAIRDYPGAAEQIDYALDSDPSDAQRWKALASLYYEIGDMQKMMSTLSAAMRYFPDDMDFYLMASSGKLREKDYPASLSYLGKALELTDSADMEKRSEIYSAMGDTYYSSEQTDSAFRYYQEALSMNPDNLLALNNCAYYMACQDRDLDKALTMIKRVITEKPDDDTSLDTYAWVLFKMKNYTEAKEAIDAALESSERETADMLEHAGDIYFMNGDPDGALDFWKRALELDSSNDLLRRKVKHRTFFFK